jgi:hypothetical protein
VGHQEPAGAQHASQDGLFIVGPAAHAEAGGAEGYGSSVQAGLTASSAEAFPGGPLEFGAALGRRGMVAGSTFAPADDSPVLVTY